MIAQNFARVRVRVLTSGSIAMPYGVASMCAHAGKKPARARPAPFVSGRIFEKPAHMIEEK